MDMSGLGRVVDVWYRGRLGESIVVDGCFVESIEIFRSYEIVRLPTAVAVYKLVSHIATVGGEFVEADGYAVVGAEGYDGGSHLIAVDRNLKCVE